MEAIVKRVASPGIRMSLRHQKPETGTAIELLANEVFPSSPNMFWPQHSTPPPAWSAQAKFPPTAKAVMPLVSPEAGTGIRL
ncbi:MAG: hypothetical protein ABSC94_18565, partial [Polyangiaceae bacterium]